MALRMLLLTLPSLIGTMALSQCTVSFSHSANWDTVAFTNTSSVANAHFYWNFGDGSTSYERDPVHVFPEKGNYLVTLYGKDSITHCHSHAETWLVITTTSADPCDPLLLDSLLTYNGTDYISIEDGSSNCNSHFNNIDAGPAQNFSGGNWVYLDPNWETALWVNRIQQYSSDSITGTLLKREHYHTMPYQYDRSINYDTCSANFEFHIEYQASGALVTFNAMSPVGVDTFYVSGFGNPITTAASSGSHVYPYYEPSFIWLIHHSNTYSGCTKNCTQTLVIRNPNYVEPPTCLIDPQPLDAAVYQNGTAQFFINTQSGADRQWQQNDGLGWEDLFDAGPYSGVNTDTLTISNCQNWWSNYQYRCVVTVPGSSCHNTSVAAVLDVAVGLDEPLLGSISVFPDPATEEINVRWNRDLQGSILRVHDALGSIVRSVQPTGTSIRVSIADLPAGPYYLTVQRSDMRLGTRFIKL